MSPLKNSEFQPEQFSASLGADIAFIQTQIQHGQAQSLECAGCHFVVRIEQSGHLTKELCVVAAEGENLLEGAKAIVCAARQANIQTIRFHSKRPALLRLLASAGIEFTPAETVYHMEL